MSKINHNVAALVQCTVPRNGAYAAITPMCHGLLQSIKWNLMRSAIKKKIARVTSYNVVHRYSGFSRRPLAPSEHDSKAGRTSTTQTFQRTRFFRRFLHRWRGARAIDVGLFIEYREIRFSPQIKADAARPSCRIYWSALPVSWCDCVRSVPGWTAGKTHFRGHKRSACVRLIQFSAASFAGGNLPSTAQQQRKPSAIKLIIFD